MKTMRLPEFIENNAKLRSCSLSDNGIDDAGARSIATELEKNSTLMELDLSHNTIGDEGAKYLADAITKNSTLRKLNLKFNNTMTDAGKYCIANALKKNHTLTVLKLGDDMKRQIKPYLESNRQIQHANLMAARLHLKPGSDVAKLLTRPDISEFYGYLLCRLREDFQMAYLHLGFHLPPELICNIEKYLFPSDINIYDLFSDENNILALYKHYISELFKKKYKGKHRTKASNLQRDVLNCDSNESLKKLLCSQFIMLKHKNLPNKDEEPIKEPKGRFFKVAKTAAAYSYRASNLRLQQHKFAQLIQDHLKFDNVDNFGSEAGRRYFTAVQSLSDLLCKEQEIDIATMRDMPLNTLAEGIALSAKELLKKNTISIAEFEENLKAIMAGQSDLNIRRQIGSGKLFSK